MLSRASTLVAPGLILLLFSPVLSGVSRLAFRDVSHFYTPLYDYVAHRTSNQWLPLWNPMDHTGMPLLGETTTAVLYPVRYLLYSLPVSSETAIGWYVALHLILASVTARLAARWSGAGPLAASFAGVIYPLSGSVLFLYTNPPFLVGAAWLPLVVGVMLARTEFAVHRQVIIAGTGMSMMILGGDPQTALHAMMMVSVVRFAQFVGKRQQPASLSVLVAAPTLAAVLAAPQLAASISWSRKSDRAHSNVTQPWLAPPVVGSTRHEAYQFSLAPWHALELATPNAYGSPFPTNARISSLIPGDGRMWTPTIYMGILVLMSIALRAGLSGRQRIDRWMAIALLSLWLSAGHFGLVWLIQAATPWLSNVDSAAGGPYWWLYQFVPGYDLFRYPAKWLSVFSIAAAIVTAQVVDRGLWRQQSTWILTAIAGLLVVMLIGSVVVRTNPNLLGHAADGVLSDGFWGPLDLDHGLSQIQRSILYSATALLSIVVVMRFSLRRGWAKARTLYCLLIIVAIDLGLCGRSRIATVPRAMEQRLSARLDASELPEEMRLMRTRSGEGWPAVWKISRDDDRMIDVEASMRAAQFGRWHLAHDAAMLNSMVSIRSGPIAVFWQAARKTTDGMTIQERTEFWQSIRNWLSIDGVVHATTNAIEIAVDDRTAQLIDCRTQYDSSGKSVRLHSNWSCEPVPIPLARRLREVAESGGTPLPMVHSADQAIVPTSRDADGSVTVTMEEPGFAEVELVLGSPSLVTRPVFQDSHWVAETASAGSDQWRDATVYPVDHLTQGVSLPAGEWKLRFQYRPWWLGWSIGVAGVAWSALLITSPVMVFTGCARRSACGDDSPAPVVCTSLCL